MSEIEQGSHMEHDGGNPDPNLVNNDGHEEMVVDPTLQLRQQLEHLQLQTAALQAQLAQHTPGTSAHPLCISMPDGSTIYFATMQDMQTWQRNNAAVSTKPKTVGKQPPSYSGDSDYTYTDFIDSFECHCLPANPEPLRVHSCIPCWSIQSGSMLLRKSNSQVTPWVTSLMTLTWLL